MASDEARLCRARLRCDGSMVITFLRIWGDGPDGPTCTITTDADGVRWTRGDASGEALTLQVAIADAWCSSVTPPPPIDGAREHVQALARRIEQGTTTDTEAASILRALIHDRTGWHWSVRQERARTDPRGIRIAALPSRATSKMRTLAPFDRAALSGVMGYPVGRDGVLVRSLAGRRADAVHAIGGFERSR